MTLYRTGLFFLVSLLFISVQGQALPPGVALRADVAYGEHEKQTLDVYVPEGANGAPVIFMVHGGGWRGGDKARPSEVDLKVAHWVTRGFVLISTNYRTLPEVEPVEQAEDVAAAIRFSQEKAVEWGGAPDKFILMGHSAGAQIASLVSAKYGNETDGNLQQWLGTVSLDPSPYDLVSIMTGPTPPAWYQETFGNSLAHWEMASPYHVVEAQIPPFLAVCSTQRDLICPQSYRFLEKLESLGGRGGVLPVDLSHMDINSDLGKPSCYTAAVDAFLFTLSPEIGGMLTAAAGTAPSECGQD